MQCKSTLVHHVRHAWWGLQLICRSWLVYPRLVCSGCPSCWFSHSIIGSIHCSGCSRGKVFSIGCCASHGFNMPIHTFLPCTSAKQHYWRSRTSCEQWDCYVRVAHILLTLCRSRLGDQCDHGDGVSLTLIAGHRGLRGAADVLVLSLRVKELSHNLKSHLRIHATRSSSRMCQGMSWQHLHQPVWLERCSSLSQLMSMLFL